MTLARFSCPACGKTTEAHRTAVVSHICPRAPQRRSGTKAVAMVKEAQVNA